MWTCRVPVLCSMPGLKSCLVERTALRQGVQRGSPKPGCAVLTLHHRQKMIASLSWGKLTDLLAPDALKVFVAASLGKDIQRNSRGTELLKSHSAGQSRGHSEGQSQADSPELLFRATLCFICLGSDLAQAMKRKCLTEQGILVLQCKPVSAMQHTLQVSLCEGRQTYAL